MTRHRLAVPLLAAALLACATAKPAASPAPAPAAKPAAAAPSGPRWYDGAVFYEVFVRSFQDTDGDGVGDFKGLTQRLDYLNDGDPKTTTDLGVDALWLMPMLESPSYHGYDVTDYEKVEKDYGTEADFDAFLAAAHARGIKVIIDLVLNHTSNQHPWFQESKSSKTSPKRDWYVWSDTDLGWGRPWDPGARTWHKTPTGYYYGLFWEGMPDLNWRNPEVRAEARRVAEKWLARGVDGFRLDAIRHLVEEGPGPGQSSSPETLTYVYEFAQAVRKAKPDAYLVGEVWADVDEAAEYVGKDLQGLTAMFDFQLADAAVKAATAADASSLETCLENAQKVYPKGGIDAPFLTNHDMKRVGSVAGGDRAKLGLAAAVLLTLPGTPYLYYGEEIGLMNGLGSDDEFKRTPMRWDGSALAGFTTGKPWFRFSPAPADGNVGAETGDPASLLSRYRTLIRARKASAALARGDAVVLPRAQGGRVVAWLRRSGDEVVLVAHNLGETPAEAGPLPAPGATAEPIFADPAAELVREGTGWRARLPGRGSGVWRLR